MSNYRESDSQVQLRVDQDRAARVDQARATRAAKKQPAASPRPTYTQEAKPLRSYREQLILAGAILPASEPQSDRVLAIREKIKAEEDKRERRRPHYADNIPQYYDLDEDVQELRGNKSTPEFKRQVQRDWRRNQQIEDYATLERINRGEY